MDAVGQQRRGRRIYRNRSVFDCDEEPWKAGSALPLATELTRERSRGETEVYDGKLELVLLGPGDKRQKGVCRLNIVEMKQEWMVAE